MMKIFMLAICLCVFAFGVYPYDLYQGYFDVGVIMFTPAMLNLELGYNTHYFDYKLTGMLFYPYGGVEFSITYNAFNTSSFRNGPGINLGYVKHKPPNEEDLTPFNAYGADTPYLGLHYSWTMDFFYASAGIGFGYSDRLIPMPLMNVGVEYRFVSDKNKVTVEGDPPKLFKDNDPLIAGILSIVPGAGHYYLGDINKASALMVLNILFMQIAGAAKYKYDNDPAFWTFLGGSIGLSIYSIIDSVSIAVKKSESDEVP